MSVDKISASSMRVANVGYCVFESALAERILAAGGADALGVWVYLINKPSGWKVVAEDVKKRTRLGRPKYTAAMAVLKSIGVVRQVPVMRAGKLAGTEIIVSNAILADGSAELATDEPSRQDCVGSGDLTSRQVSGGSRILEAREIPTGRENDPLSNLLSNKQSLENTQAAAAAPAVVDDDTTAGDLAAGDVLAALPPELRNAWPHVREWPAWVPVLAFARWCQVSAARGKRVQPMQVPAMLRLWADNARLAGLSPVAYLDLHLAQGWRSFQQVDAAVSGVLGEGVCDAGSSECGGQGVGAGRRAFDYSEFD